MEKLKLKRYQVGQLHAGLRALDGYTDVLKDGDGKAIAYLKRYDLSGKARYAIAKTLRAVQDEMKVLEDLQQAAIKAAYPDGNPTDGMLTKCDREIRDINNGESEIEVHTLAITELKVETNQIPSTVLANLDPILTGEIT